MKWALILPLLICLSALFFLSATLQPRNYDPSHFINLTLNDVPLEKVLSALEKKAPCAFTYCTRDIRYFHRSIVLVNATFDEALAAALKDLPLEAVITDRTEMIHITLRRKG